VYVPRLVSKSLRRRDPAPPKSAVVFLAWAGMRGGDTLVTALALPLVVSGGLPFVLRDTVSFIAFFVIFVSLVVQAPTLAPLSRVLGLRGTGAETADAKEEHLARAEAVKAGVSAIRHTAAAAGLSHAATEDFIRDYEHRRHSRNRHARDAEERAAWLLGARLERAIIRAEREQLLRLRDEELISDGVMRIVQQELDHDELALDHPT
jgi:CPA1 family monovalent cation:H+ antiporter